MSEAARDGKGEHAEGSDVGVVGGWGVVSLGLSNS